MIEITLRVHALDRQVAAVGAELGLIGVAQVDHAFDGRRGRINDRHGAVADIGIVDLAGTRGVTQPMRRGAVGCVHIVIAAFLACIAEIHGSKDGQVTGRHRIIVDDRDRAVFDVADEGAMRYGRCIVAGMAESGLVVTPADADRGQHRGVLRFDTRISGNRMMRRALLFLR